MEASLVFADLVADYKEVVVEPGNQPALLLLIAFGATFGITRFITHSIRAERFSWLGDIEAGDTHIHHLVWGIILLLVSGVLAVFIRPPLEVTAIIFGIGAALTLDEFALWLHLDDVYWSEKGRQSIDAVIIFVICTSFMLIGFYPVTFESSGGIGGIIELLVVQALNLVFVIICFTKGKLMWGVVGIYIPLVAIIGSCRLARPDSMWAKRRYDETKLARSRQRYAGEEKVHRASIA